MAEFQAQTVPIDVPNDVQVNYSADGITMNLFSIFENNNTCTDYLFLILTSELNYEEEKISSPENTYFYIKFNINNSLTFLFPPPSEIINKITLAIGDKYSEFIVPTLIGQQNIIDFYTLFKSLIVTHTINILKTSKIIDFLKKTEQPIISCGFRLVNRNSESQNMHTDEQLFVALTYERGTLTPEIILMPRKNDIPEMRHTEPLLFVPLKIEYPPNIKHIFRQLQVSELLYKETHSSYPVLRFDITDFVRPTVVFSDFIMFHASPHKNDDIQNGIIQNIDFNKPYKQHYTKYTEKENIPLKSCVGRQNCIEAPSIRTFIGVTFNFIDNIPENHTGEFTVDIDTMHQSSTILEINITPETFEPIIESIIQTGMLGNIRAKGVNRRRFRKTRKNNKTKSKSKIKKQISWKKKKRKGTPKK
jgi:hypothetical protein